MNYIGKKFITLTPCGLISAGDVVTVFEYLVDGCGEAFRCKDENGITGWYYEVELRPISIVRTECGFGGHVLKTNLIHAEMPKG